MPRSARPGICGDETLSTCISSTWFRVMGGRGKNSAIEANARQGRMGWDQHGPNVDFVCDGPGVPHRNRRAAHRIRMLAGAPVLVRPMAAASVIFNVNWL